jgi:uncharacterized membrane protein/predicted DsbA family dithiol-disulfide isomerase
MTAPASPSRSLAVVVALLGLALSLWLEVVHYRAYMMPSAASVCSVGAKFDCASVALSRYSVLLGIPMPLWGVAGFLAMSAAAWGRSRWLLPLSLLATLGSLALLSVELFAIGSVCLLCAGVHIACAVLLVLAWRQREDRVAYGDHHGLLLIFAPAAGLLIALVLFQRPYWGAFSWKGDVGFPQGKTAEGYPWLGAEQPTLVVHEFTDYSCPHCKAATNYLLRVLAEHPKQLRLVRRQFARMPCPVGVPTSCQMARVAYCAEEQGRFWPADRWLFEHATGASQVDLAKAANEIGLDAARLRVCVERTDTYKRAEADAKLAHKKQVPGTPYYALGTKLLSPHELAAQLDRL